uniref:Uncharacterized protein n=1 Tax=Meloidogyne floridensis TaxID=298350 RepID=A0A915NG99_9BILA
MHFWRSLIKQSTRAAIIILPIKLSVDSGVWSTNAEKGASLYSRLKSDMPSFSDAKLLLVNKWNGFVNFQQELQHTKLLEGSSDQTDTLSPRVGNPEGPKLVKFLNFWEQFNLENGFKLLGHSIGVYPLAFLIASLILSSLSVGIYWLEIKDRVRDGYTPTTSMSRYETDVLKEFLGSTGDPLLTTVLIRARDGGSMHRLRWLNASVNLHSLLHLNISADLDGEESLNSQLTRLHAGKRPSNSLNLTYPISRVNGFDLHLERNFYGVKLRNNNETRNKEDPEVSQLSKFTNIEHIEAIMMTFRADISHPKDEEKMARWEMRVYEFSQNQFNNSLIEMLVLGSEIVDYEMAKEAEKTLMLFAPLIYFASIFEENNSGNNTFAFLDKIRHEVDLLFNWILKIYCKIISNRIFGFLLLFGVLIYWYFALAGTLNIQAKLDTEKILPRSSPILQPHKLISHMVWTEYYPLTILVNNPIDIRLKRQFDRFNTMLEEFEGLKFCKGKQFTILWLRDYIEYCKMAALYDFDFFDNGNNSSEMHVDSLSISETGFDVYF